MASLPSPSTPLVWSHTPADVRKAGTDAIEQHRQRIHAIASLPGSACSFDTVFLPLAQCEAEFSRATDPLVFNQGVSPSQELREASNEVDGTIQKYKIEVAMRVDLFMAKKAAQRNILSSGKTLTAEEQRLVDKMVQEGVRAGLALPNEKRDELKEWKKELAAACLEFNNNYNEEKETITFDADDLRGVPVDAIADYTSRTDSDKEVYDLTFQFQDIFPVFQFAQNPETRLRAFEGYESRLLVNIPILDRILELRRKIADLLGYGTWADYVTEVKMAKSAQSISHFLKDVEDTLRPLAQKEHDVLLGLKKREHEERGFTFDGKLYACDLPYYSRVFNETRLQLDGEAVQQYFPVTAVVPAILEVYQELLDVKFFEIDGDKWHPDVSIYVVRENDTKNGSDFIGHCYLDLYPREGKNSTSSAWVLPGFTRPHGSRSYPVTAMIADLAKPAPAKPALMRHDEVVTFFHEMGHVFHGLLSKTRFSRFHGPQVANDFVEAPSQMLENWCWEPKVLKRISSHYETNEPLPDDIIEKIVRSRYVNVALPNMRQLFFANFDLKVHSDRESTDYTQVWNEMREKIALVSSREYAPGQATFGHITGGYDAGYYGYTYSLVLAADMYKTVFEDDPLDPRRGKRYREKILLPGGSRDEMDTLVDFLGRPPNSEAFVKQLSGEYSG